MFNIWSVYVNIAFINMAFSLQAYNTCDATYDHVSFLCKGIVLEGYMECGLRKHIEICQSRDKPTPSKMYKYLFKLTGSTRLMTLKLSRHAMVCVAVAL